MCNKFYTEQKGIVAQVVQKLQSIENKPDIIVAQVVPQIQDALVVDADSAPVEAFPYFLGMILASYAKLYSNSNRFSLANIRKIKRTILPEREVKDEGDEV